MLRFSLSLFLSLPPPPTALGCTLSLLKKQWSSFFFSMLLSSFPNTICWRYCPFPIGYPFLLCWRLIYHIVVALFLVFYSVPLICDYVCAGTTLFWLASKEWMGEPGNKRRNKKVEANENETTEVQNIWDASKVVLSVKLQQYRPISRSKTNLKSTT